MTQRGYSNKQGPRSRGPAAPVAEALGTGRPTGRTGSAEPSHYARQDASNDRFKLTYYDPPAGLERHVLALFHFEWDEDEIVDRHPGALGQLFLTPRGRGEITFGAHAQPVEGGVAMFSGFEVAAPFRIEGPWHSFGASLSPLGWASLARVPANTSLNRLLPAHDILGDEVDGFADDLNHRYRSGKTSGEQACRELGEWIAPRIKPIAAAHEAVIERTLGWLGSSLNPDVESLFATLNYSRRQAERLVTRYFGFTPAALARKMRAIRSANLLSQPDLTDEGEAEIAAAFYDQPHMIREIRRYCGYTPARLGGAGEPLFQTMLRMKNLDRLKHYRNIGAKDSG
ncbi:helix-turn-helix domain-containing protein [uncultured Erythrobacter sp.]|uniref:helix-turn-helix transcriptional regulator n=1 Tax=uncultured Erythrobacter sp. TaxID=263913 RepID=UPI0026109467|nr:helix-turn-helix domain-containing protein [uncultured Erythrobacter sp.]